MAPLDKCKNEQTTLKLSELVEENTWLWWQWMKLYPLTKDGDGRGFYVRADACMGCEKLNVDVSRITRMIDKVFDD